LAKQLILKLGVADLGYEGLNMQVRETSIHKASGFSSYFFHTLIKQRLKLLGFLTARNFFLPVLAAVLPLIVPAVNHFIQARLRALKELN
ncbi:MAG: hypothetical protein KY448_13935, partial [Cyanobacteria bacterium 0813]|nr:hypothetical protein [Cyanobacteria bacterium 0813]